MAIKHITKTNSATVVDLIAPGAATEVVVLNITVANNHSAAVNVIITVTDSSNAVVAYILPSTSISAGNVLYFDSKFCLSSSATPDKIRITPGHTAVYAYASWDET
jgi:hypothetical protein